MKRKIKIKKRTGLFRLFIIFLLWLLVGTGATFVIAFIYFSPQIPNPESIINRRITESTKIFDRTGKTLLYEVHGQEKRTIIPDDQIPELVKQAVIAAEDANFYKHRGIDLKGIIRAGLVNIKKKGLKQGGSTITQQLVRNSLLDREKTFARKFKEIILSLQIEYRFDKNKILWMYLNQISFGSNLFGIESASQGFFGKPTKELSLNEAATLAGLIKAPSFYSPYGSNKERLIERKNKILEKMKELGFISKEQLEKSRSEELRFKTQDKGILAPHFVIMVREYLVSKYGEEFVQNSGLRVYTTLDWDLQKKAEEIIAKSAEKNEKLFRAKNAALVAIDPKTGQILALVGSRDYFDERIDGNFNVATALRQPGSAFKPIAYSVAIDKGLTDKTILFDVKTEFNPYCSPDGFQEKDIYGQDCYHPQNSDGKFRGPVTLRQALGSSLNVPSVKVLYLAGIEETIKRAKELGINSLDEPSRFGLSLILGGGEVKLLELTGAYGAFANDGIFNPPNFILKIESSDGKIIDEFKENPKRVVPEQTARIINDILSDNTARILTFGLSSPLNFSDRQVAVKTGTTQKFRDAWTIGYTPSMAIGVWVGNNDNTEMTREGGGVSAGAPIWHEVMKYALSNKENEEFIKPEPVYIDKIMLNGNYLNENGEVHTILHYIQKENIRGQVPLNPEIDPQYKNWEWAVRNYYNNLYEFREY